MDICIENLFPALAMPFNPFQRESPRDPRNDEKQTAEGRKAARSSAKRDSDAARIQTDGLFVSIKAETADTELLDGHIAYLCERLSATLRASGRSARTIGIQIRYADQLSVRQTVRLPQASNDDHELLGEARELLASASKRPVPVQLLGLSVTNLEPWSQQESLEDAESALAAA